MIICSIYTGARVQSESTFSKGQTPRCSRLRSDYYYRVLRAIGPMLLGKMRQEISVVLYLYQCKAMPIQSRVSYSHNIKVFPNEEYTCGPFMTY